MKSSAPALIPATAIGTSAWPEISTTGKRDLAPGELAHQLDSVHAGHAHVGDHAAGTSGRDGLQETVRGIEYLDRKAEYPQHFAERVADGVLIVDDKDGGHDRGGLFEREPETEFGCAGRAGL